MNISPNNEKIEKYLDELSDEYKELLFKALVSRSKSLDNLSISELLRLDSEIKKPLFEDYQRQQKRRKKLLVLGLTYMFFGFSMFVVFQIISSDLMYDSNGIFLIMSVIIGLVGGIVSAYSFALPTIRTSSSTHMVSDKKETSVLFEYEAITKWRELEGIVNDISISSNVKTPRSIIEFLFESQFIGNEEYDILKDFLKMRNDLVHSTGSKYSEEQINNMVSKIDKIIGRIKKIV
jgi:hypothetical protein